MSCENHTTVHGLLIHTLSVSLSLSCRAAQTTRHTFRDVDRLARQFNSLPRRNCVCGTRFTWWFWLAVVLVTSNICMGSGVFTDEGVSSPFLVTILESQDWFIQVAVDQLLVCTPWRADAADKHGCMSPMGWYETTLGSGYIVFLALFRLYARGAFPEIKCLYWPPGDPGP